VLQAFIHATSTMSLLQPQPASPDELHPHLLYRTAGGQAEFATWRLNEGHEALALFSTADAATRYQSELAGAAYTLFQPPRDKLLAIFQACLAANIRLAALDPSASGARTLFDLAQILAAAKSAAS
jgi:hypothetical protein